MEYVSTEDYKKFVSELKSYVQLDVSEDKVTITSGMHIGYVCAYKDGKGYMIDSDLLK